MNKKVIIIIFILIAGISFFIFRKNEQQLPVPTGTNIIAFGDSLVYGYGATEGKDFVSLLSERIGIPIINAGIPGDKTSDALARIRTDVLEKDPKVVIVVIGGNDFLRRVPKAETLSNVRNIVGQIKATGARVILVGTSRLVYNSEYQDVAKELGVIFVPHVMDKILSNRALMSDTIHPNDAGYEVFADTIEPFLIKALN